MKKRNWLLLLLIVLCLAAFFGYRKLDQLRTDTRAPQIHIDEQPLEVSVRDDTVNMSMRSESEGSMNEYLMDTIKSVFPYAWTVRVSGGTNLELFATADEDALARFEQRRSEVPGDYAAIMQRVDDGLEAVEGGDYILTDDKAPVELLGMAVLDEIIANELDVLRDQIAENGIMSLLE